MKNILTVLALSLAAQMSFAQQPAASAPATAPAAGVQAPVVKKGDNKEAGKIAHQDKKDKKAKKDQTQKQ